MGRIRVGVIGAGGIAQIEHVPNLLRLRDRFELLGVCDPSAIARDFMADRYGIATFESVEHLLHVPLDAVVIASPDALHKEQALSALAKGLHVFCEKPLCYGSADIAELIAQRDKAGRVLQVGYMKRFDPAFEAALDLLPGDASALRHICVEVTDPDAWPFIRHHEWRRGDDVPRPLIAAVARKQKEQVARAVGLKLDDAAYRGFCAAFASSLVHDVNAVHGLLDRLGIEDGEVTGAALYAGGDGGHGSVKLRGGQALWTMTHLTVPRLPDYRERISLYFDDATLELEFPSPWLNHQPTRLTLKRARGHQLHVEDIRVGYEEAFIEELKGFADAITGEAPQRNTAEEAARDMDLLCALARASIPSPRFSGEREGPIAQQWEGEGHMKRGVPA
ncbi:Gfo/Idh/MocA family protein [Taklimakanibacter lacteus]|uniref:Gfo/Idh/MocA family protein n=1 Tax=Taklimakanibacter lacteus TaxID=2268456 RepID=UPI000E662AF5